MSARSCAIEGKDGAEHRLEQVSQHLERPRLTPSLQVLLDDDRPNPYKRMFEHVLSEAGTPTGPMGMITLFDSNPFVFSPRAVGGRPHTSSTFSKRVRLRG